MGTIRRSDQYGYIDDKADVGFLDFDDDRSLHDYDPYKEGPIVVTAPFPFVKEKPQSAFIGKTAVDSVRIINMTSEPVELWRVWIYSSTPEDSYLLSLMKPPLDDADEEAVRYFCGSTEIEDRVLQPRETLVIWVSCKPKFLGQYTAVLHFKVGDDTIERIAFLLAEDKLSRSLFSNKPYRRASSSRSTRYKLDEYVAGNRPPSRSNKQNFINKLPPFEIPKNIREIIENKQVPDVLFEDLSRANYPKFFSTLLVMEEISLEEEMRAHGMESVKFSKKGKLLSLKVPGLAEKRPSLVYGDFVFAKLVGDDQNKDDFVYQGFIHRVAADEIFLQFDDKLHFQHQEDNLFNVNFSYNRVNMRRLYQAVESAQHLGDDLLFPSQLSHRRVIKTSSFMPLNPFINREQSRSVEMILGCRGYPPYVIHGPPGTGKTMTLVEAVLQLYARRNSRILVCSSSNSAADHVLEKLNETNRTIVHEQHIFRLNASSRPMEDVDPALMQYCCYDPIEQAFSYPSRSVLMHYKIIVSTYMSASLLYAEGIRKGHFSHIFLDEAGQSSEPETMVPISNLSTRNTVIVLAGDPMQLGPVIFSRDANKYGLAKSYLERLFGCDYYLNQDENYVTKLVRNYRCHPAILDLPSRLFYKGQLFACKEDDDTCIYQCIDLPNKAFPVLFIGLQGLDEREGCNPSWFNRFEVSKVVEIIRKLMRSSDLSEADIGVITPYRQQVLKLKQAFGKDEFENLKVGSVEQFQGQERKVIIISTVRSTIKHNDFDRVHNLGFLSNPRRFNVAITRARSLLIIVGNPHIIAKDRHWDKLLRYCADNGSYEGCPLPSPEWHGQSHYECNGYSGGQHSDECSTEVVEHEKAASVVMSDEQQKTADWGNDTSRTWIDESNRGDDSRRTTGKDSTRALDNDFRIQPTGWNSDTSQPTQPTGWNNDTLLSIQPTGLGDDDNSKPMQPTGWNYDTSLPIQPTGWGDDDNSQPIQPNQWDGDGHVSVARSYELKWGNVDIEPSGWD